MKSRLQVFEKISDFEKQFLAPRAKVLAMDVARIGLDELTPDWKVSPASIDSSKGFFQVGGVRSVGMRDGGREVPSWSQPMIVQPDSDRVILFLTTGHPGRFALVHALAELGNRGYDIDGPSKNSRVLVAPTFQCSGANFQNGAVPLADYVDADWRKTGRLHRPRIETEQGVVDGGRFFEKQITYGLLHFTADRDRPDLEEDVLDHKEAPNFAWVNVSVLSKIRERGWVNAHLRSVMSLLV